MNKAEEQALEVYPIKEEWMGNQWDGVLIDVNATIRDGFIEGYKQAEQDLALTWQDIQRIVKIADQMVDEDRGKFMAMEDEDYYKEVLERYVKQSEKP